MYKVVVSFMDLTDYQESKSGKIYHSYNVGDAFPRAGKEASDERITELSGTENKRGVPLIEMVAGEETDSGSEASVGVSEENATETKTKAKSTRKKSTDSE